ncbi:MAG: DegV family EDD domain-containing protein [Butyrivibrio sp.]|nr:DegV family EDD domain-containing protein [Butyrivibrio sp.]
MEDFLANISHELRTPLNVIGGMTALLKNNIDDVPVVILTANAGGENIELYNNSGFDGYLVKPVSGMQLEEMLINQLPEEKVITSERSEMTGSQIRTASGYSRKKPVVIAASSMTDLPKSIIKELEIAIIPFVVITKEGVFWDNIDIDSDGLLRYMGVENRYVSSEPPSVEALTKFFSDLLKGAHHVIYIALTSGASKDFEMSRAAAKSFGNVTVVESETLSSAAGLLVMIAGRLARQNYPVEKIVSELDEAKKRIQCSFVIRSTETMARRGQISPAMNSILNTLWLRPVLKVRNDKMGVGGFLFGRDRRCYEKYIKNALSGKNKPDKELAFITYAGMDESDLEWIEDMVRGIVPFEHLIFQKASAGIFSNCGPGSFGILFLERSSKNYNLSALLPREVIMTSEEEPDQAQEISDESQSMEQNHEESVKGEAYGQRVTANKEGAASIETGASKVPSAPARW